MKENPSSK